MITNYSRRISQSFPRPLRLMFIVTTLLTLPL